MTDKLKAETVTSDPRRALRLWIGVLGWPALWAIQFQTVYLASEWGCYAWDFRWIHVASIAALVLSLPAVWTAYSEWRAVRVGTDDENSNQDTRRRFMAILGLLTGGLFTAAIVATWLPMLSGVPCGK